MHKIVVLGDYPKNLFEMFDSLKKELGVEDAQLVSPTQEEKEAALMDAEVVIAGGMSEADLNAAPNLKFIQVPFAGVDSFDVPDLVRRGIKIANVHDNAAAVAEFAFALVLALAKNVVGGDRDLRIGYWHGWQSRETVVSLEGKTMTILGAGNIGREIAKFAKAFNMHVIGVKREKTNQPIPNVDEVYTTDEIETAVEKGDFIVCALPLTNDTKGMVNKKLFEKMRGKFFVNVGRGAVVNEEDLFVALKSGILRGAGIDTWWVYPPKPMQTTLPSKYPFHGLHNIVMTPHAAGATDVTQQRMWETSVRNVLKFIKGLPIENEVKEFGY